MSQSRRVRPFQFQLVEGVNEDSSVLLKRPSEADQIINMHMMPVGSWTANRQGYEAIGSALAAARVDSLLGFTNDAGSRYIIAACNGDIKALNASGTVTNTVTTANTPGYPVFGSVFKGSLYLTDGTMTPVKWDGATASGSTSGGHPVIIGGDSYNNYKFVATYANRLVYGAPANFPSHIVLMDTLAAETYTTGSGADNVGAVIQVNPGDGQKITALRSWYIPDRDAEILLVFKERSIYRLTGTSGSATSADFFQVDAVSQFFGCVAPMSIVQVGNDFLFLGEDNIYSLTTAAGSGNIQPAQIGGEKVRETLSLINRAQFDKSWAVHLERRKEVWFAFPTGASTEPDTILVYRYPTKQTEAPVWSVRKNFNGTCGLWFNGNMYTGATDGYVQRWFGTSRYRGNGVGWLYQFPWYKFEQPGQIKRVLDMWLWVSLAAPSTISVTTEWRGGGNAQRKTFTKAITLPGSSGVYGAGVYGSSMYGTAQLLKVKLPVYGNGEDFRLRLEGSAGDVAPVLLGVGGVVEFASSARGYK